VATLGIDLGTSNSAASLAVGDDVIMVEPAEGMTDEGMVFPSYVAFNINGKMSCAGITARRQFHSSADLVIRHSKRLIGRSYDYISSRIEERQSQFLDEFKDRIERGPTGDVLIRVGVHEVETYTPQQIAEILLRKIRDDAAPQARQLLGAGIDNAVITVPAGFDDAPLRATLWAGEQVFGQGNVQLIPEPLAAAISSGVPRDQETIMVVDMGAGTTDIVVGNVIRAGRSFNWAPITQSCDDELGGWDMDGMILDHLLRVDQKEPLLRDIYPLLDLRARGRLMEAIERAKIASSSTESGQVSVVLEVEIAGRQVRKPFVYTLSEQTIRDIVAYKGKKSDTDRGSVIERCRRLVEETLMELADNDPSRLEEVKAGLDRVILVGGPMRMRCLYSMMCEVFAEQIDVLAPFDPLNPFPMECVAKGAALFQGDRVMLQVPHTLSIYEWGKGGYYSVIPRGTPYEGEANAAIAIEVDEGPMWLDIITEKGNVSLPNFPVREHLVRVPKKGKLEVTLRWDTRGCRVDIGGAGIAQTAIPPISDQTTLTEDFERQFNNLLKTARNLRELVNDPEVRQRVGEMLVRQLKRMAPGDVQLLIDVDPDLALDEWRLDGRMLREYVENEVNRLLNIPEDDLKKCDSLVESMVKLREDDIRLMLHRGYTEGAKALAKERGITERAFEVARVIRNVSRGRVTVDEMLKVNRQLLRIAAEAGAVVSFEDELEHFLRQLESGQRDRVLVANVSIRMAALADVLHDQGIISREALRHAKWIAAQAEG